MTTLWHGLAAALYLLAALLAWRPLFGRPSRRSVPAVMVAGLLAQGVGLYGMHLETPPVPLESMSAAVSLMGWLVAGGYIGALAFARIAAGAIWASGLAALLTLGATLGLGRTVAAGAQAPAGLWSHAHVLLSASGFSLLALASLSGVGYLAKERDLKRKRAGRAWDLPSLESLDRAEHLTLSAGFALLTLGVVSGFAWGLGQNESPWTGHSLFMLLAWAVYLFPLGLRVLRGQHGPRPARGVVIGFAILAFSYLGVRALGAVA